MTRSVRLYASAMDLTEVAAACSASPVDWVARTLALLAGAIGLFSAWLAWRNFRRGGAHLRVTVTPAKRPWQIFRIHSGIWLPVRVRNRGLAAAQITGCRWDVKATEFFSSVGGHHAAEGDTTVPRERAPWPFPMTVEGLHHVVWRSMPPRWNPDETGSTAYRMRVVVALGDGRLIKSRWIVVNEGVDWPTIRKAAGWRRRWIF